IEAGSSTTTLITTNPQSFSHTPLVVGTYKVTIAETGDISQTPAIFTVTQPSALSTFASDCTSAQSNFTLGNQVCAKANNLESDPDRVARRIELINPNGYRVDSVDVDAGDTSKTTTFTLPTATSSSFVGSSGNISVDNRGTWLINETDTRDGAIRRWVEITVRDPQVSITDLQISKLYTGDGSATPGSTVQAVIWVFNAGPDS